MVSGSRDMLASLPSIGPNRSLKTHERNPAISANHIARRELHKHQSVRFSHLDRVDHPPNSRQLLAGLNGDLPFIKRTDVASQGDFAGPHIHAEPFQAGSVGLGELSRN